MKLQVKVTAAELRVRKGAGTSFGWTKFLKKGDIVTVTKESNGFYQLSDGSGWIGKKYTTVVKNLENNKPGTSTAPNSTGGTSSGATGGNITHVENGVLNGTMTYDKAVALIGGVAADEVYKKFNSALSSNTRGEGDSIDLSDMVPPVTGFHDYKIDLSYLNKNMDTIRKNINVIPTGGYDSATKALFDNFNRFKVPFPEVQLSKGFGHIFFTRPNLNIVNHKGKGEFTLIKGQTLNDPIFYSVFERNKNLLSSLTRHYSSLHDFHPYLSNSAQSFELSDEFIKTIEHGETLTGYKVQYGKNNIESNTAGNFSVNYTDDNDLNVYWIHKLWVEYISKVSRGEFSPIRDYVIKKILDYACSVYYFLVGPDGETIIYWSKYFGVFPTSVPSSAFGYTRGAPIKSEFAINYAYSYKEDGNPLSLAEFNMNSRGNLVYKKTYEPALLSTGRTMSGAPFIETVKGGPKKYVHKLRYRKSSTT